MKAEIGEPKDTTWRRSLASPLLVLGIAAALAFTWYYAPSLLNTRVTFGSLADCVHSAIAGRVVRDESLWQSA